MNKKVGRPKVPKEEKVKYKIIPVQYDTFDRLKEIKVRVAKEQNNPNLTWSELLDLKVE